MQLRNLIGTRNIIGGEYVPCQQQSCDHGGSEKIVHALIGLRIRTASVLRVLSLPGRKPTVPGRHLW